MPHNNFDYWCAVCRVRPWVANLFNIKTMTKSIKTPEVNSSTLTPLKHKTMTKSTKITIANNGASISFDLDTANGKSIAKIQRALVLRFFDYYDTMRAIKAKGFKATEPFNISMHVNNVCKWNTGSLDMRAQATLKLQNTVKGRAMYESRLNRLVGFALRSQETDPDKIKTALSHLVEA